jgi:uncharacterized protein YdhG (YjbR/CyaY superfamily)
MTWEKKNALLVSASVQESHLDLSPNYEVAPTLGAAWHQQSFSRALLAGLVSP